MKSGQVVRQKNGGPLMAIVEVQRPSPASPGGEEVVDCVWFEGKSFVRGKFSAGSLETLQAPVMVGKAA